MEGLERCSDEQVVAFAEHVARLKHDLGKYIRFRQNWLSAEAGEDEVRAALVADLHHTRRGPDGSVDAQSVWAEFRPVLLGETELLGATFPAADARVQAVERAMVRLAALEPLEEAGGAVLQEAMEHARGVAEGIRELAADLRDLVLARRSA
ncbi:MAG: hypothetical protein H6736_21210 [Alphaproteobacteria bacterium]|nr:hypothetical protein [Alphaproteobacteria bacterium]MCB9694337.1 hypothetical protein [Alphaproteobacteria bacterium]